jgi:hypothetical protein
VSSAVVDRGQRLRSPSSARCFAKFQFAHGYYCPCGRNLDVGLAIGAGTDVAVEAGDNRARPATIRDVARIIDLYKASY